MSRTDHVRVPSPVYETAQDVKDEYGYGSLGEAIRHMCRQGGYDV